MHAIFEPWHLYEQTKILQIDLLNTKLDQKDLYAKDL